MFQKIHAGEFEPFCFHMCWTAGKADKLKFLKQERLWLLAPECDLRKLEAADGDKLRRCGVGSCYSGGA